MLLRKAPLNKTVPLDPGEILARCLGAFVRAGTLDLSLAQLAPESFPSGVSLHRVLTELWKRTVRPEARGVLLLVMDVSRRAWRGSARARGFYAEQQRLWVELLM